MTGAYRGAFPDLHFTIEAQVAEGDRVVTRWTAGGTNTGSLGGMPPTGKAVVVSGISIERIAGGKVAVMAAPDGGSKIAVGIKSRALQWGPVVGNNHRDFAQAATKALAGA